MNSLIFACLVDSDDSKHKALILAKSIRKFAGTLSNSPIWVLIPDTDYKIPTKMKEQLRPLDVQLIPFSVNQKVLKFPFAGVVFAAATVESLAMEKSELLAWLGTDTIVINEPKDMLLSEHKNLGYRPVHHTLVGSIYEESIDPFWELVYQMCNVPEEKIFPMKTHVDGKILRPYFNAGFLIVRPEKGLLQSWWDRFKELYRNPAFKRFYQKNRLYSIFIHQVVLTGIILSKMQKEELQELPFTYNYPLHLFDESPSEYRPQTINDLITARFEEPETFNKIPLHEPLKSWIHEQLSKDFLS
ncbi:MAG: hypothetical protein ACFFCQ_05560 [Promethearchaeota archaeon]